MLALQSAAVLLLTACGGANALADRAREQLPTVRPLIPGSTATNQLTAV